MIRLSDIKSRDSREKLKIFGPAIVVTIIGFVIAWQYVAPAPPRTLTMATGSPKAPHWTLLRWPAYRWSRFTSSFAWPAPLGR